MVWWKGLFSSGNEPLERKESMPTILNEVSVCQEQATKREEAIRTAAYLKWEAAGFPPGDGVNFWLEAEEEFEMASREKRECCRGRAYEELAS